MIAGPFNVTCTHSNLLWIGICEKDGHAAVRVWVVANDGLCHDGARFVNDRGQRRHDDFVGQRAYTWQENMANASRETRLPVIEELQRGWMAVCLVGGTRRNCDHLSSIGERRGNITKCMSIKGSIHDNYLLCDLPCVLAMATTAARTMRMLPRMVGLLTEDRRKEHTFFSPLLPVCLSLRFHWSSVFVEFTLLGFIFGLYTSFFCSSTSLNNK